MADDAFVLSEVKRLQYLTGVKRVTRYDLKRDPNDISESVGEHISGLMFLAAYFSRLETVGESLDMFLIHQHILFHDTDELETGDVPTNHKTDQDRAEAQARLPETFEKSPQTLRNLMMELYEEYEGQTTEEAKFTKALDKLEGVIHCFQERQRPVFDHLQFTAEDQVRTKERFIQPYPIMFRFYQVITAEFKRQDFFYTPA